MGELTLAEIKAVFPGAVEVCPGCGNDLEPWETPRWLLLFCTCGRPPITERKTL